LANERRGQLDALQSNARERIRLREQARQAQEEEDMTRLLESMAIKQHRDEEELARKFAEREKQLWSDIDAAIKEVERQEEARRAEEQDRARREREEAAAKAQRAEKEAQSKREEKERDEYERAETERRTREKEARAQEEETRRKAEETAKAEEAERNRQAKGKTETEWKAWTQKQAWMKSEVIATIKADRQTKMALKAGMRLITRGLGQVVNTKDTIIRVVSTFKSCISVSDSRLANCIIYFVSSCRLRPMPITQLSSRLRPSLTCTSFHMRQKP
jgi:nucleoporin GLE1